MTAKYDVIVIGSGAGGGSAAYKLANGRQAGAADREGAVPSARCLDARASGRCSSTACSRTTRSGSTASGDEFVPGEFYNVGGKTKWYGAALFRFRPVEFEAEPDFDLLGWPFGYEELKPYYDEATELLKITTFKNEPELQALLDKITTADPGWKLESLPLGLSKDILSNPEEAKHFDGFASPSGFKSDAERNLIDHIRDKPNFTLIAGDPVTDLVCRAWRSAHDHRRQMRRRLDLRGGHGRARGRRHDKPAHPPGLSARERASRCPAAIWSAPISRCTSTRRCSGFSPFKDHDVLRKTAVLYNDRFPHSSMQCLGWIDGEVLATQVPPEMPRLPRQVPRQTRDRLLGDHGGLVRRRENRIISGGPGGQPIMDYSLDRIEKAKKEHDALVDAWIDRLLHAGLVGFEKYMGVAGTAHALGSMVTGDDPKTSVVDPHGKVHGMEGLYVGDGSALPRASRVNPSLTIYAWGLRLGDHLARAA